METQFPSPRGRIPQHSLSIVCKHAGRTMNAPEFLTNWVGLMVN